MNKIRFIFKNFAKDNKKYQRFWIYHQIKISDLQSKANIIFAKKYFQG